MEHRWGQRFSVDIPAQLGCRPAAIGLGRVRNLSLSGAYVATALRPALFAHVEVVISDFDHGSQSRTLSGFVVRHDAEGFGIEWSQFGSAQIAALLQHLAPELAPLEVALDQYRRTVAGRART
jgi:hypothetical protein